MIKEEYRTGLWSKESKRGNKYYEGKIKMGEREYKVVLFQVENKKEKSPDYSLIMELIVKNEEKKSYTPDEVVYANFGETQIKDEDLAF